MPVLVLLAVIVAVVWRLNASGDRFLKAFSGLLAGVALQRGWQSVLSGRSYLTGRYSERPVAVRLQMRRGRHSQGYLVIAMQLTGGQKSLDYARLDAQLRAEEDRRALATLATRDLLINVEDGWLKALWRPQGFAMFPGPFSSERWQPVLDAMRRVSQSLDEASSLSRGTTADS